MNAISQNVETSQWLNPKSTWTPRCSQNGAKLAYSCVERKSTPKLSIYQPFPTSTTSRNHAHCSSELQSPTAALVAEEASKYKKSFRRPPFLLEFQVDLEVMCFVLAVSKFFKIITGKILSTFMVGGLAKGLCLTNIRQCWCPLGFYGAERLGWSSSHNCIGYLTSWSCPTGLHSEHRSTCPPLHLLQLGDKI